MILKKFLFILILGLVFPGIYGCQTADDRMISMGPEVKASLVIFFKKDATSQQVEDFGITMFGTPTSPTEHSLLPGTASTVGIKINGYQGVAVVYTANATEEQKSLHRKTGFGIAYRVQDL